MEEKRRADVNLVHLLQTNVKRRVKFAESIYVNCVFIVIKLVIFSSSNIFETNLHYSSTQKMAIFHPEMSILLRSDSTEVRRAFLTFKIRIL